MYKSLAAFQLDDNQGGIKAAGFWSVPPTGPKTLPIAFQYDKAPSRS